MIFNETCDSLPEIPPARRMAFLEGPATAAAHAAALDSLPAFRTLEVSPPPAPPPPPGPLRIAAWNLERGLFPQDSAALLRREGVALTFLTEADCGCHRTGQRHVTRVMAEALGQGHAYGAEFLELAAMPAPLPFPENPPGNRLGFHGNGLLSALPFRAAWLIRLPQEADWFIAPRGGQRRIGARMAVAALFEWAGVEFLGCSIHLESDTDFAGRARQMAALLDALDLLAEGRPVVAGGDLNTRVAPGGLDDPREALFEEARRRGYDWAGGNTATASTRASLWNKGSKVGTQQLDWLFARGCTLSAPRMTPALGPDGTPLSDHEMISATLSF
ncbi:endonuclease/exonuclease/phosphatase family protein [Roseomonas sp. GC11]|uniref:endonuclease/exonuclease/phosphatase family protein n=1 Tax=Roseomonas sp. GC11 TaxID=2950546 RepID=UPI00210F0F37|nr:endonuclease/exonuclease/phosphatase family protein [Roseomonas sp. GC11]MCQ4162104.1 endonuclease/exonuclease/phosphatase family protein [Roseomonas sp. GC11]